MEQESGKNSRATIVIVGVVCLVGGYFLITQAIRGYLWTANALNDQIDKYALQVVSEKYQFKLWEVDEKANQKIWENMSAREKWYSRLNCERQVEEAEMVMQGLGDALVYWHETRGDLRND